MLYRWTLLTVVMGMLLIPPSVARGADVDDLRAATDQFIAALNQQDLDGVMALYHDQAVVFGTNAPFPTDGKAALRQGLQMAFSNNESLTAQPMNPQYRVIGNSGIVIGHGMLAVKPKDGPLQTLFIRVLQNWVKADGKWLLVSSHLSRLPSGN